MKSHKHIRRSSGGFTIVETLIVLGVAGLILLLVFEAIPALQRSGRNNRRRQDVSIILESVSHYELNDSGNFPLDCGGGGASPSCSTSAGGSSPNDFFLKYNAAKLTYYTSSEVQLLGLGPSTFVSVVPTVDQVFILNYQKCDSNGSGQSTPAGAGYNSVVALFSVETGGGKSQQCEQL